MTENTETPKRKRRYRSRRSGTNQSASAPTNPTQSSTASGQQQVAAASTPKPQSDQKQQQPGNQSKSGSRNRRRSKGPKPQTEGGSAPIARGATGKLRIIPMGGVGEVGKNCTVVEFNNDLIMLDAGGKFPEENQHAIDLVVPDVSYVKGRMANLRAILITHGHEDHIGGLPYILAQLKPTKPVPVYGSPLAMGLLEAKVIEHRIEKLVDLQVVEPGQRVQLGKMQAEFVHVTHSIPDTNAIAIHTPVGTIIDTADFKFDPTPVMGEPTNERQLQRMGNDGVLALLSDTVRVESEGSTPSEKIVAETINRVTGTARGQVVIASFASNISRLKMALDAAEKHNRVVAVAGRSMEQSAKVAIDLGYLTPRDGLMMPLDEVLKLPASKRILVVTGSQGEPAAALSRIAMNDHPKIRVTTGDVVLISATPVPGNEETVTRTIDNLFRRGAKVVYSGIDRGVHVSGHASRDELRKMIDLVRPKYVIPIHGEYRHMSLYRDLCKEAGIGRERVIFPEIGSVIELTASDGKSHGRVPSGSVLVDRLGERSRSQFLLRDPAHLTDEGMVIVTFVVRSDTGELIAGPDLTGKGIPTDVSPAVLKAATQELTRMLERQPKGEADYGFLARRAREVVSRSIFRRSKRRPLVLPAPTTL